MAHQELQCETVTLCRIDPTPAGIRPGAVAIVVAPVLVELPILVYTVEHHWPDEQPLALQNISLLMPDFRGPPARTLDYQACRGARSCAPHIIHSSPRGIYAH